MSELVLGTAQFGSGYGVTNTAGRLPDAVVSAMVARARGRGVRLFDTASGYGDAEARLGAALGGAPGAAVVTKVALPPAGESVTAASLLDGSRERLGTAPVHAVLLHRLDDLRDPRLAAALDELRAAREAGHVARLGVSAYTVDDLDEAVAVFPDLDIVQVPGSVVDRRLLDSPELLALHGTGVEVHVRSVFLQGALLAAPESLPGRFGPLLPHLRRLREVAREAGVAVETVLVQQVRDHPLADAVVVGATGLTELDEVLDAFDSGPGERVDLPELPVEVLDPRLW